jgi:preprotein translocase subunit SecF
MFQLSDEVLFSKNSAHCVIFLTLLTLFFALFTILFVPLNKSIEFTGGAIFDVVFFDDTDIKSFTKSSGYEVVRIDGQHYKIKISSLYQFDITTVSNNILQVAKIESSSVVAPSMTPSLIKKSLFAVISSVVVVFIYIFLRFNIYYSFGAIMTIAHDVILSFAFVKIMHIEFSITTIASLLTLIGYSVNDTVIIYDKIRSNLTIKSDFTNVISKSIKDTLPRTIGTSLTTILAILPVIFFTTGSIQDFCKIVVFGIIIGTFSSISVSALFLIPFRDKIINILKFRKTLLQ